MFYCFRTFQFVYNSRKPYYFWSGTYNRHHFQFFHTVLNLQTVSVWFFKIKRLVCPHNGDHIGIPQVFDVMRISWWYIYNLQFISTDIVFYNFIRINFSKTNNPSSTDYQKFFYLRVMPVISFIIPGFEILTDT